jgi:hypothetical protein
LKEVEVPVETLVEVALPVERIVEQVVLFLCLVFVSSLKQRYSIRSRLFIPFIPFV